VLQGRFRRALIALAGLLSVLSLTVIAVPLAQAGRHAKHHTCAWYQRHQKPHRQCQKAHKRATVAGGGLLYMGPEPAPSIFGIDTGTYDTSRTNYVSDFPAVRSLGARWDRFTAGPATGTGNYATLDDEVTRARRQGMGVIISLAGIAPACSQPTSDVSACPPTTASDLSVYQAYVKALVLHYRNVVEYYESWPEPNNRTSWRPAPNPGQYAALLEAQHAEFEALKSQYGLNLTLLFGSPSGFSSVSPNAVLPFTDQVLNALGGDRAFDGVALHAYRFPPTDPNVPESDYVAGIPSPLLTGGPFPDQGCSSTPWCQMTWPQELSAYEDEFANHGFGRPPLWLTEFGWPGNAQAGDAYHPSYEQQGAYAREAYADLLKLPFLQGALWFNGRDYQPSYSTTSDPEFFFHFGLLDYGFSRKPAADAFAALADANPNH
jgi:hypothetical protein